MSSLSVIIDGVCMRIVATVFFLFLSFGVWAGAVPSTCFNDVLSADEKRIISDWVEKRKNLTDIENQAALAVCAFAIENYAIALKSIDIVIGVDEVFPFAIELRGRIYMGLGKFSEAIDDFSKSILMGSGSGDEYYYIAKSYYMGGHIDEAISALRERVDYFNKQFPASEKIPRESFEEVRVYSFFGEILYLSGDAGSALSVIEGGYLRNSLSLELFDALIYLLLEVDMKSKADLYMSAYCKKPLISSSVYCNG